MPRVSVFVGLLISLWAAVSTALPVPESSSAAPCNEAGATPSVGYVGLPEELAALYAGSKKKVMSLSDKSIDRMGLKQAAAIAQAARCPSVNRKEWQCGEACSSMPDLKILWTYGDNREIPYIFVAHSSAMQAVVVAHAGSNFMALESWLIDFNFDPEEASRDLYNGKGERPKVHDGFHELWRRTNRRILPQVNEALQITGYTKVVCVGHSLGGAVAQMDAVYLRNKLPKRISVQYVGFGTPRVGNKRWASIVESTLGNSQVHMTNSDDVVPHTPPSKLGFTQTGNEIWINPEEPQPILCRGREDERCAAGVSTKTLGWGAHGGPYFGVTMQSELCQ